MDKRLWAQLIREHENTWTIQAIHPCKCLARKVEVVGIEDQAHVVGGRAEVEAKGEVMKRLILLAAQVPGSQPRELQPSCGTYTRSSAALPLMKHSKPI